jgi:hypothetical protein
MYVYSLCVSSHVLLVGWLEFAVWWITMQCNWQSTFTDNEGKFYHITRIRCCFLFHRDHHHATESSWVNIIRSLCVCEKGERKKEKERGNKMDDGLW